MKIAAKKCPPKKRGPSAVRPKESTLPKHRQARKVSAATQWHQSSLASDQHVVSGQQQDLQQMNQNSLQNMDSSIMATAAQIANFVSPSRQLNESSNENQVSSPMAGSSFAGHIQQNDYVIVPTATMATSSAEIKKMSELAQKFKRDEKVQIVPRKPQAQKDFDYLQRFLNGVKRPPSIITTQQNPALSMQASIPVEPMEKSLSRPEVDKIVVVNHSPKKVTHQRHYSYQKAPLRPAVIMGGKAREVPLP